MGGGDVPQPRSAFQDYRDTTRFMSKHGAEKSYRLAKNWEPRFTELSLRDAGENANRAGALTGRMLEANQGMTDGQNAIMRGQLGDAGVTLSDAAYARMMTPINSEMTQQRMANLQGLYPMMPQGAFTPMSAGQVFGAQRQSSAFNQALGSQAAAFNAAQTNQLIDAGFGAAGTGLGYWGQSTNWGQGNGNNMSMYGSRNFQR
jgi:hypothetical protein